MPIADRDESRIVLTTEFREREIVKNVPGVRWSTEEQTWWLPLSWAGCVQLRGVFGEALRITESLNDWAREQLATRITPCLALREAEDATDPWLLTLIEQRGWPLKPFQRAGVAFLATAKQALLADEMGLGKTVQTICALEVLGDAAYPAIVVCPASMKLTWAAEFAKWAPGRRAVVIAGTAVKRRKQIEQVAEGKADVAIINFEGLAGHSRLEGFGSLTLSEGDKTEKELNAIVFKSAVADEAHRVKDPRSKQTRALWWIARTCENRFALTGTPVANSPEDVWTLMRFVCQPEFPVKGRFIERYAMEEYNVFGFKKVIGIKSETKDELFSIIDPRFVRRLKAVVLPQLPPKTYSERFVTMVPKQKAAYESLRKEMMVELESGVLLATSPLTKMTRLLQFASAMGDMGTPAYEVWLQGAKIAGPFPTREAAEVARQGDAVIKDVTPLILSEPSCKVDALEEIACELGEQRAVVFAESRQLIELAAARLVKASGVKNGPLEGIPVAQVTGNVPEYERQDNVNRFNQGDLKLLLITLGAGGEGLSFPGCSTGIFLQRSFNAVLNLQAEDRIHGIGRGTEGVASEIIDIITEGTAEQRVHAVRSEKAEQMEEFCRDEANLRAWLAK